MELMPPYQGLGIIADQSPDMCYIREYKVRQAYLDNWCCQEEHPRPTFLESWVIISTLPYYRRASFVAGSIRHGGDGR